MRGWPFLLLVGCQAIGVDLNRPLLDGQAPDAAADASSATCDLSAPFEPAQPITGLLTTLSEWSPSLTDDELVIVFLSDRATTQWIPDIWIATRPNRNAPWENIHAIDELKTPKDQESGVAISGDGLDIYFTKFVDANTRDVFTAHRSSRSAPFDAPRVIASNMLYEFELAVAPSKNLYMSATSPQSQYDLVLARFDGNDWVKAAPMSIVNDPKLDEHAPAISADELTLYFGRLAYTGFADSSSVWVSRRANKNVDFGEPELVAELDIKDVGMSPAWISRDGCRLYMTMFSSDQKYRDQGRGWYDLAVASKR